MKYYNQPEIPSGLTYDERVKLESQYASEEFDYIISKLHDIQEIFDTQLAKNGDDDRNIAIEHILKYLLEYRYSRHELEQDSMKEVMYARSIISIANIVDAINNNNEELLAQSLNQLAWGVSNMDNEIAEDTAKFAYWILSDEDREKYYDMFIHALTMSSSFRFEQSPEKAAEAKLNSYTESQSLQDLIRENKHNHKEIKRLTDELYSTD